jgi:hypothetical protein
MEAAHKYALRVYKRTEEEKTRPHTGGVRALIRGLIEDAFYEGSRWRPKKESK